MPGLLQKFGEKLRRAIRISVSFLCPSSRKAVNGSLKAERDAEEHRGTRDTGTRVHSFSIVAMPDAK